MFLFINSFNGYGSVRYYYDILYAANNANVSGDDSIMGWIKEYLKAMWNSGAEKAEELKKKRKDKNE